VNAPRDAIAQRLDELRRDPAYQQPFERHEPLVTVRIATYNNGEILTERTLPTLLAQSYDNWEAIVVGDAVTDDTESRIRSLGDSRIRFLNLPVRGPYPSNPEHAWMVAGTRPANVALHLARGDWIAALDHDDEWTDDHLEVLLKTAKHERAEIAYGKLQLVDAATGTRLPVEVGSFPPVLAQFGFMAAIVHRALSEFTFDPLAYLAGEPGDWNLCRRLLDAGARFAFVDRCVAYYWFTARSEASAGWLRGQLAAAAADR
jgi:glycosyltransferase involved in cell wall biosynthesis